jgi:SPP1 family predicted phage head-tail adaptor
MRAGELRDRIEIQRATDTSDGAGGTLRQWAIHDVVWAKVVPGTGREFATAKQTMPALSHMVSIRYRSDLSPAMRIRRGSQILAIHSTADVNSRGQELLILCEERPGERMEEPA